jgi:ribose 5-phosphate isomerase B
MKIAIGADHGGVGLKEEINKFLTAEGHKTMDFGTHSTDSCDYPVFAYKVAKAVSEKKADVGVLICKSGNGMAIVANKLPGVRAAMCYDRNVAMLSRQHNDANILVLGSEHLFDEPETIVKSWLAAEFEGGRHQRRVDQITDIEKKGCALSTPKKSKPAPKKKKAKK